MSVDPDVINLVLTLILSFIVKRRIPKPPCDK